MLRPALALLVILGAAAPVHADDTLYACKKLGDRAEISVSFTPGVTLDQLVTWYSSFTCATVVYSEEVGCRTPGATLVTPEKMTVAKARALFLDAIEVMGLRARVKASKIVLTEKKTRTTQPSCTGTSTDPVAHGPSSSQPVPPVAVDLTTFKKIDATHFEVPRATIDALLADPMAVTSGAKVTAVKDQGFKLSSIKAKTLWTAAGFVSGDIVTTVAGFPLTSADKALDAYSAIKTATTVKVELLRKGKPVTLEYVVK